MFDSKALKKYILAIDHGTSAVKSALFTCAGELVDFEAKNLTIQFLPGGGAEQDPEEWWKALLETGAKLVTRNSNLAQDIVAVCVSSTFSSTVAVDDKGRHLGNALTWLDSRGAPYIKELLGGFPNLMGYNIFKMLPWIWKTAGGPQLSGKDDIAHILYWKNAKPDIYEKAHKFLGSKDYLNFRLTGEFAASFDSIMLFWLTNTRDINNVHYDDWLIKQAGIDKNKLPALKKSIDILGMLKPEVANQLGISPSTKVIVGSPDHQCACIGSGAVRDFEGHLYIGTSSWIQCIVPFKKTDVFHSIASLPTAIPGKYYAVNEQDIAGGVLPFLVNNIIYNNLLNKDSAPADVFQILDQIAEKVPPGSNKLIFTPWLNGERTPVDDTTIRGGLYNMSMTTRIDEIIRAFMEGVAYNTRWALKYVEKFIGRRMDQINIVGGGGKSELWCQIFADVLDRRIKQVKDPMQANSRGAAFIASVGLGLIRFEDIPDLIQIKKTFEPDSNNRKIYDELFSAFLEIYKNNRAMYRRLNKES